MADDTASSQDQPEAQVLPALHRLQPEKLPTYYANSVTLETSIWDVAFDFGLLLGRNEQGQLLSGDQVRIYMSPQHAKAFAGLLATNVKLYEDQFGMIPTPTAPDQAEP